MAREGQDPTNAMAPHQARAKKQQALAGGVLLGPGRLPASSCGLRRSAFMILSTSHYPTMTTIPNSSGKKPYCVYADSINRVYQDVEADSPQEAYTIAKDSRDGWQNCFEHEDSNNYRVSTEVQDLLTQEFI